MSTLVAMAQARGDGARSAGRCGESGSQIDLRLTAIDCEGDAANSTMRVRWSIEAHFLPVKKWFLPMIGGTHICQQRARHHGDRKRRRPFRCRIRCTPARLLSKQIQHHLGGGDGEGGGMKASVMRRTTRQARELATPSLPDIDSSVTDRIYFHTRYAVFELGCDSTYSVGCENSNHHPALRLHQNHKTRVQDH